MYHNYNKEVCLLFCSDMVSYNLLTILIENDPTWMHFKLEDSVSLTHTILLSLLWIMITLKLAFNWWHQIYLVHIHQNIEIQRYCWRIIIRMNGSSCVFNSSKASSLRSAFFISFYSSSVFIHHLSSSCTTVTYDVCASKKTYPSCLGQLPNILVLVIW